MTTRWSLGPCALANPSTLFASPPNPRQGCWPSVDVHVRCNSVKCCKIRELDMSDEKEVMSRRRVLSLLGLAGLSLAVPTVLTVSDATISDAEAQAAPPAAPAAGPQTGTERRQERRIRRTERRQERRQGRRERRMARREGRAERREIRRTGGSSPQ